MPVPEYCTGGSAIRSIELLNGQFRICRKTITIQKKQKCQGNIWLEGRCFGEIKIGIFRLLQNLLLSAALPPGLLLKSGIPAGTLS